MHDLAGTTALVTGAGGAIGAEACRRLAFHGARLVLSARDTQRLDELSSELMRDGHRGDTVIADLSDSAAVAAPRLGHRIQLRRNRRSLDALILLSEQAHR